MSRCCVLCLLLHRLHPSNQQGWHQGRHLPVHRPQHPDPAEQQRSGAALLCRWVVVHLAMWVALVPVQSTAHCLHQVHTCCWLLSSSFEGS